MVFTSNIYGKDVSFVHDQNESKFSFDLNGNLLTVEILKTSNNKKAKEIQVTYVEVLTDSAGEVIRSAQKRYEVTNPLEYGFFYNLTSEQAFGQVEYMHAINGALARCAELGGTPNGVGGPRVFNVDGSYKLTIVAPAPTTPLNPPL